MPAVNSSLRPYFNQAVYGTQVLDYAVDSVSSSPVEWWLPEPKDKDARRRSLKRSTVYLHRKGDFVLPVIVEVVFDDGHAYASIGTAPTAGPNSATSKTRSVVSAEIDPDHVVLLDVDMLNNSYTTKANGVPALKLSNIWESMQQFFAQLVTWIV